jgi:argininosuccinate lyase
VHYRQKQINAIFNQVLKNGYQDMSDNKSKLWRKKVSVHDEIHRFTVGNDADLDLQLSAYDVLGSIAHIKMLAKIGLLTEAELNVLTEGLAAIHAEIINGSFTINQGVEDVHSQVELLLTDRYGEVGKKIHAGRSRNDQVLLDLKLFMRSELLDVASKMKQLFNRLITLSQMHKDKLMPGYTHLQVAMPSSFGLWFGAYAESLSDDLDILKSAYDIVNRNPLGSAAGYGSSFELNRQMTTELLGFESMNYNVIYAQMGRGKTERVQASAMASVADTLGRLAMDICIYMGQNHGFLAFPDEYTTGSSIMPHKKNPDVFEIIRARSNKIKALPNQIAMATTNLPSGYHRDLQVIKEDIMSAFAHLKDCLHMMWFMLEKVRINDNILSDERYKYIFSVEEVNRLVLSGMPFRDAYATVAQSIENGAVIIPDKINHTHEGSIGNLCNDQISARFNKTARIFDNHEQMVASKLQALLT